MRGTGRVAALAAVGALLGCGTGDEPTCGADTADWYIECPADLELAPGQQVATTVRRADIRPEPLFLYFLGASDEQGDVAMSIPVVLPVGEDEVDVEISTFVPPVPDGTYRLAVGDQDGPRSNELTIRIIAPEPRLSREQAAAAVSGGLERLLGFVDDTILSDDPEWQAAAAQLYTPGQLDPARARIDELRMIVPLIREDYLALPADSERTLQAYYDQTGLLGLFEGLAANPDWPRTDFVMAGFGDTIDEPMHRLLVTGDTVSWGLEAFGFVADVEVIVTLLFPGAQPLAAVGMGVKLFLEVTKFVIDTFLPTDLKNVEVHGSKLMFDNEPAAFVYWGEFGPENDGQGTFKSLDGLLIEGLSRAIPGPKRTDKLFAKMRKAAQDLAITWSTRLGLQFGSLNVEEGVEIVTRVKCELDMNAYRIPMLERLASIPGMAGVLSWIVQKLITAFDLAKAVELENITPDWAQTVMLDSSNANWLRFYGMSYPANAPDTTAGSLYINAEGYALGGEDVLIFTIPRWIAVRGNFGFVSVQKAVDSTNPNQLISDESFIFDWIDPGADQEYLFIDSDTSDGRAYPVGIKGVDGFIGGDEVDIYVNNVLQVASATTVFNITTQYLLQLVPGRNEIRFDNKNPNIKNCSTGGTSGQGCLVVSFPNTVNLDRTTTIVFGATDGSRTFEVFTPPAVGP